MTLGNIAITLSALGRFPEATGAARTAIAAAERVASDAIWELGMLHLARMLFCVGSWQEALDTIDEAAPDVTPANAGMAIGPPVLIALARGERDRARSVIESFDRRQAESGAAIESDYRGVRMVALAHLDDDPSGALAAIVDAGHGDYAEWPAWLPFAVDLLVEDPDERALAAALDALRGPIAPRTSPHVGAQLARLAAHIAERRRDRDEAATHWRGALDAARRAVLPFDAAVISLEIAERRTGAEAAAGLGEALATFERLRAAPWAERARRRAQRAPS
jgi:hypothetical protein